MRWLITSAIYHGMRGGDRRVDMLAPVARPGCLNYGCLGLIALAAIPIFWLYLGVGGNWFWAVLILGAAILFAGFGMAVLRINRGGLPERPRKVRGPSPRQAQERYWNEQERN